MQSYYWKSLGFTESSLEIKQNGRSQLLSGHCRVQIMHLKNISLWGKYVVFYTVPLHCRDEMNRALY